MNDSNRPLVRLGAINRELWSVGQELGDLLIALAEQERDGYLTVEPLRVVGRELIALAGDVTTLGVDMARWADDLDRQPACDPHKNRPGSQP
jgi:hypothetical protein